MEENIEKYKSKIRELETGLSELKIELEDAKSILENERQERVFYQLVADFSFGWELWFEPGGRLKYCSPSCFDLTGFSANQIIASPGIDKLLVFEGDQVKYNDFLSRSLNQSLVSQSLDFRILTRTKQMRWCSMNVRGVYDKQGKYLGIRASVLDVTRLKRAMGQIQEMEISKEFEARTKQRLQTEIGVKDRELVSFLLQLSQKNEIINKTAAQLKKISFEKEPASQKKINQLVAILEDKSQETIDWANIENQIEQIHPGFLHRLQSKHSTLTLNDKKLCTYLRLGLTSKEIAGLVNISPKSIEISRVRLRKKLKIQGKTRLSNYLDQL